MLNTIKTRLQQAKHVLVFAVGGGNDSVSTLLLQKQLSETFKYTPKEITIVAMLPDVLDYHNVENTEHELIKVLHPDTTRSVQGHVMSKFPEPILASHKTEFKSLPIVNVLGINMHNGTIGVANAVTHLWETKKYDTILAIDVGGDFIAVTENKDVLSPMMDSYMLYALQNLTKKDQDIPIIYGVFGLGTDGETTPALLNKALKNLKYTYEGTFNKHVLTEVIHFYRSKVEPMRYSRTTDFTIKEILNNEHENPAIYRARFHIKTDVNEKSKVYYGNFKHLFNQDYYNKYYLFTSCNDVKTPLIVKCHHGIEWFLTVQNENTKLNHELNGQAYMNLDLILNNPEFEQKSVFFGTPSNKFNVDEQLNITNDVINSIINKVYTFAFVYTEYLCQNNKLSTLKLKNGISLITLNENKELLKMLYTT